MASIFRRPPRCGDNPAWPARRRRGRTYRTSTGTPRGSHPRRRPRPRLSTLAAAAPRPPMLPPTKVRFTGVAQNSGQLQASSTRDSQSNCWASFKILGQPCEFQVTAAAGGRRRCRGTPRGSSRIPPAVASRGTDQRGPGRAPQTRSIDLMVGCAYTVCLHTHVCAVFSVLYTHPPAPP